LTKNCGKFKSEHFLPPRKKLTDFNTFRLYTDSLHYGQGR
jgi:hypothetical protein